MGLLSGGASGTVEGDVHFRIFSPVEFLDLVIN